MDWSPLRRLDDYAKEGLHKLREIIHLLKEIKALLAEKGN